MSARAVAGWELLAALFALAVTVWCLSSAAVTTQFTFTEADAPTFASTHYSGSWIVGATAVAIVGAILMIDAVRRLWPAN